MDKDTFCVCKTLFFLFDLQYIGIYFFFIPFIWYVIEILQFWVFLILLFIVLCCFVNFRAQTFGIVRGVF